MHFSDVICRVHPLSIAKSMDNLVSPSNCEYLTKGELHFIIGMERMAICKHLLDRVLHVFGLSLGLINPREDRYFIVRDIACDVGGELILGS